VFSLCSSLDVFVFVLFYHAQFALANHIVVIVVCYITVLFFTLVRKLPLFVIHPMLSFVLFSG
jgi:hypothetical protein